MNKIPLKKEIPLWPALFFWGNLFIICLAVIAFLNLKYPLVGHDYSLAVPQILDTILHFRNNGLSIQWYSPSFGGGLPAFPNPNNIQFSLPVFLGILLGPWLAINISSIFFIFAGFAAGYYFFSKTLKLHWTSSILGAVFFSANGFIMQRVAVGHLGYQAFPLLAILVLVLLDGSLSIGMAAITFSLIIVLLIYQAGFFIIIVSGISLLLIIPIVFIFRPQLIGWKRFMLVAISGCIIAMFLSISKLYAIYSFMRFFPRQIADNYQVNFLSGLAGLFLQLLGTMNLTPMFWAARLDTRLLNNFMATITGAEYGFWEFDMSMSPLVFGLLLAGMDKFFHHPLFHIKKLKQDKKWIAMILLIIFLWLAIEFTVAKGLFYPYLQHLPILSSLHVNIRFAAAFLFPFSLLSAVIYNKLISKWSEKKKLTILLIINIITLLPLYTFFTIKDDLQARIYNVLESKNVFQEIKDGKSFDVTSIGITADNTKALVLGISNLNPYDPIFGYKLENFHPELNPGSIWEISDGYFNMSNPSSYVFPEENHTRAFERFRIDDINKLAIFAKHIQPDFAIPIYQSIANWISILTLGINLLFFGFYIVRILQSHQK